MKYLGILIVTKKSTPAQTGCWQQAIQKRLTEEDFKLTQISRKLRVEEFDELRKGKNKVWHGKLAGKLLVDVLEADLMEVEKAAVS